MNLNVFLAVDDNEQSLALMGRLARSRGFEASLTRTSEEFKHAYLNSRPTLIAIDVLLGGEDCGEILDFLARCRCSTPIALVTGYTAEFMAVLEARMRASGLKLIGKVEKKRNLFVLDDLLKSLTIPEIEDVRVSQA
jgi:FixJ family two-component response regulator